MKDPRLRFDGRGITIADASGRFPGRGDGRREVEKRREEGRRAAVARLFIVACAARSLAMQTCTAYVAITSSHLRRSRARIFAIDESAVRRVPIRSPRRSISIAVGPGRSFFGRGCRSLLCSLPRFVAAHYHGLGATRESGKWKREGEPRESRAASRRDYNSDGYTVAV